MVLRSAFERTRLPYVLLLGDDGRDEIVGLIFSLDGERPRSGILFAEVAIVLH